MPKMSKNIIEKRCSICKQSFYVYKYRANTAKFCGKKCLGKHNARILKNNTNGFKKGKGYWTNKHRDEQTKIKIRLAQKGKYSGENSWNYIKDRSLLKKDNKRNDSAYKNWRLEVYKRDNYKCRINNCDCSGRIIAHHILGFTAYPELQYQINNGITLCQAHHPLKRAEEKRLAPTFQELVSVSN